MFFGRMMEPPDTPKHNAKSVTGEQSCICVLELSIFSPFLCNFPIRFWICCNRLCVCVCFVLVLSQNFIFLKLLFTYIYIYIYAKYSY